MSTVNSPHRLKLKPALFLTQAERATMADVERRGLRNGLTAMRMLGWVPRYDLVKFRSGGRA